MNKTILKSTIFLAKRFSNQQKIASKSIISIRKVKRNATKIYQKLFLSISSICFKKILSYQYNRTQHHPSWFLRWKLKCKITIYRKNSKPFIIQSLIGAGTAMKKLTLMKPLNYCQNSKSTSPTIHKKFATSLTMIIIHHKKDKFILTIKMVNFRPQKEGSHKLTMK